MKHTNCERKDCLNFWMTRSRGDSDSSYSVFCLAGIDKTSGECNRYTPPSWKPWMQRTSKPKNRG